MKINDLGYAALATSIVLGCPPDRAFEKLDGRLYHAVTQAEIEDMIKLKKEYSYREMSEIFGMNSGAICKYIKAHTEEVTP